MIYGFISILNMASEFIQCALCKRTEHTTENCMVNMHYRYQKLTPKDFIFIKERQGRGRTPQEVSKETRFDETRICNAFGSPDFEYYRSNYGDHEFSFTTF